MDVGLAIRHVWMYFSPTDVSFCVNFYLCSAVVVHSSTHQLHVYDTQHPFTAVFTTNVDLLSWQHCLLLRRVVMRRKMRQNKTTRKKMLLRQFLDEDIAMHYLPTARESVSGHCVVSFIVDFSLVGVQRSVG